MRSYDALKLPLSTLQPYASLAGKHRLQVILAHTAQSVRGVNPPLGRPHVLEVEFAAQHCQTVQRLAAPPQGSADEHPAIRQPPALRLPARR